MTSNPIDGTWFNQLGSEVHFVTTKEGLLTGKYKTGVSIPVQFRDLAGRYDFNFPTGVGVTIGWAVSWYAPPPPPTNPVHSTTTWCGQYFRAEGGHEERIVTQWLLTRSHTPAELWKSTHVGQDTFTRHMPTAEEIAIARAKTVGSPSSEQLFNAQ